MFFKFFRVFSLVPILICICALNAGAASWYPLAVGDSWVYSGYYKSSQNVTRTAVAAIPNTDFIVDGQYYFFSVPDFDIRFYVNADENGAYMKLVRYPFPVLSFFSFDVIFKKSINFVRHPFRIGETWRQETDAVAQIGPFTILRKVKADFKVVSRDAVTLGGRVRSAYNVTMDIDEGDGQVKHESHWYIDGIGYYQGDTELHHVTLQSFSFK